ncbi:MAG: hypothetical protein PF495_13820 [Spirochaetales bacterium]|jgi:hypothetical protein|nr:hypothetical protein [Spirochaetales bacterium]
MNFIFQRHPQHPWVSDWTFEPRNCGAQYRQNNPGHFFRTQEAVGRIIPDSDITKEWILHIPVPQNSRITLLSNGFCAYLERKKQQYGAEVFCPEPGILWGRTIGIPECALINTETEELAEKHNTEQWIEGQNTGVLLTLRNNIFCLISK